MAKKKTQSNIPAFLLSSTGNGSVSLTIKSLAVLAILTGLEYFGITADRGVIVEGVNQIATMIAAGFTLYGLARKIK